MSFEYLLFLDRLFTQLLNNFLNDSLFNLFALDVSIEILIGVPVRIRRALLWLRVFFEALTLDVLLGIEDDDIVQKFIGVPFRCVDLIAEKPWKLVDESRDIVRNGLNRLKSFKDNTYGLSDFVRLLCVLFAIDWLPGLALSVMRLIFVEVLVAHKYFIAFHFLNNIIIGKIS